MSLLDEGALATLVAAATQKAVADEIATLRSNLDALGRTLETLREALPPKLVDARTAAAALGVSLSTVHRRIKDGSLPVVRLGSAVRVDLGRIKTTNEIAEAGRQRAAQARRHGLRVVAPPTGKLRAAGGR